ncbi:MAG: response regulator transcription factor [Dehalococcoidia bacterium]|nr:response regulator transcription factor [Dehalococcoidia bacterium]
MKEKVLLVDDHLLFRKGLASLLQTKETLEVIGEARDGREAIEFARLARPDVILMDIMMPVCDGIEATRCIKQELPECKIIILTVSDQDKSLFEAIKAGAHGYLLKNTEPAQLFEMIEGVTKGEAALSPTIATKILLEFAKQLQNEPQTEAEIELLSGREKEVLNLISHGACNREIAVELCIAENTVKNHLRTILEKLHLQNRVQLATYAIREVIRSQNAIAS